LATALLTLGTTIVYYNSIEVSLPHGLGTAVLAGSVWYWLRSYGSMLPSRWFFLGIVFGATALVRWQLATFVVLPVGEMVLRLIRKGSRDSVLKMCARHLHPLALAALAAIGSGMMFLPQIVAWRFVYGAWLVNPIQGVKYHPLTPSFWTILFSQDRSLFYWTPITMLVCMGAIGCLRHSPRAGGEPGLSCTSAQEPLWLLGVSFLIQVAALACIWGQGEKLESTGNFAGVFLSRSFGFRDLTESLVVLAPGLAWLLEGASQRWVRLWVSLGLGLVTWNLLPVSLYTNGMIPSHAGATPAMLLDRTLELVRLEPFALVQALEGPGLLFVLLLFMERNEKMALGPCVPTR
jgi:hypothetical protein